MFDIFFERVNRVDLAFAAYLRGHLIFAATPYVLDKIDLIRGQVAAHFQQLVEFFGICVDYLSERQTNVILSEE